MPSPHDVENRRDVYCAWLTANNIDPSTVPIDGDLTITTHDDGTRTVDYETFHLTPDGHRQIDERNERAAVHKRSVPLLVDPPTWWEPYVKPTREQLLEATDRVRALHVRNEHTGDCEHCSERDYPDYAVPFPCPTIQALDGKERP